MKILCRKTVVMNTGETAFIANQEYNTTIYDNDFCYAINEQGKDHCVKDPDAEGWFSEHFIER